MLTPASPTLTCSSTCDTETSTIMEVLHTSQTQLLQSLPYISLYFGDLIFRPNPISNLSPVSSFSYIYTLFPPCFLVLYASFSWHNFLSVHSVPDSICIIMAAFLFLKPARNLHCNYVVLFLTCSAWLLCCSIFEF